MLILCHYAGPRVPRWQDPRVRQADVAITTHTALRIIIAPTVLISNSPPRKTWIPNAINTAIVALAMTADSLAAQRFHMNSPTPAITYAKPATKLNQRTKGTILPTAALSSPSLNRVFPPTMIVTMPNATATRASIVVQRGGRDIVLFMTCAVVHARNAINLALGVMQCSTVRVFLAAADKWDRDPEM